MEKIFEYTIKAAKEEDVKRCVATLLRFEERGYDEIDGETISYKREGNAYLAKIEYDLYNEYTLMDLPNLWDSREDMLCTCKDVAEQLPNCGFKIIFKAYWEIANYFQKGECTFTGKWIEYSDFAYTEEEPPTYLKYSAVLVNGEFCDEEKVLLEENDCPVN